MAEPAADQPKEEEFNLKPIETQMLVVVNNNQQAIMAVILSMIATERLGYKVTDRTQFKLNQQLDKILLSEVPDAPVPTAKAEEPAPEPPKPPKAGAVEAP